MKRIPDKSIKTVLTDPPYGIDYQSARKKNKDEWFPKIKNDTKPFIEFIKELPRILSDDGCAMIFTRWDVQQQFIDELTKHGLKPKNVLIWDKNAHGMGDLKRSFGNKYESIIFVANKDFRFQNKRPVDIVRFNKVSPQKLIHPNEKPIELLQYLIEQCSAQGDIVLDCFMGSGSTGVACKNTGRKFAGIELDEQYFNIAKERIEGVNVI